MISSADAIETAVTRPALVRATRDRLTPTMPALGERLPHACSHPVVNMRWRLDLDGVSVTVNGKPAYVYYISPTQLNVLAPDDPAIGSVPVQAKSPLGTSNIVMASKGTSSPGEV